MNKYLSIFFVLILFLASCKSVEELKNEKSPEQLEMEFQLVFTAAEKSFLEGLYADAEKLFLHAVEIKPTSAASAYQLANIYIKNADYDQAENFSYTATLIQPGNEWYQKQLAGIYVAQNDIVKAIQVYQYLIDIAPDKVKYKEELAALYALGNNYLAAIKVYDKLESEMGVTEHFSLQKFEYYNRLNKHDAALDEINKLIRFFPNNDRYYGILAEQYTGMQQYELAYKTYLKLLEINPSNGLAHLSLAGYYLQQGMIDEGIEEHKLAFENPTLSASTKIDAIKQLYESNLDLDSEIYDQLINILVAIHQNEAEVHQFYANFLYQQKDFDDAIQQSLIVLDIEPNNFQSWDRVSLMYLETYQYKVLNKFLDDALEYFPNQAKLYLYKGIANLYLEKGKLAISFLKMGKDLAFDEPSLILSFYIYLGEAYNQTRMYSKSDWAFEKALQLDSDNISVLNNYSYYLSQRRENLMKAKRMSLFCINKEPQNPTFLDTHAWVLYQLKEYAEAKVVYEKALKFGGNSSATIVEHFGDLLLAMNQIDKAILQWKKAFKLDPNNKELKNKIEKYEAKG